MRARRRILSSIILFVIALLLVLAPLSAFADSDVDTAVAAVVPATTATAATAVSTIQELPEITEHGSKQTVTVRGEVVGDMLNEKAGYRWLLLQDGNVTISVLVTDADAKKITHLGRYNQVGTTIEVTGEYQADCDDHDGLTDIHATKLTVIAEGYSVASLFDQNKLKIGALMILIGGLLTFVHWRLRERTR